MRGARAGLGRRRSGGGPGCAAQLHLLRTVSLPPPERASSPWRRLIRGAHVARTKLDLLLFTASALYEKGTRRRPAGPPSHRDLQQAGLRGREGQPALRQESLDGSGEAVSSPTLLLKRVMDLNNAQLCASNKANGWDGVYVVAVDRPLAAVRKA